MTGALKCVWCEKTAQPPATQGDFYKLPDGWYVKDAEPWDGGGGAEYACSVACLEAEQRGESLVREHDAACQAGYDAIPRGLHGDPYREAYAQATASADAEMAEKYGNDWRFQCPRSSVVRYHAERERAASAT